VVLNVIDQKGQVQNAGRVQVRGNLQETGFRLGQAIVHVIDPNREPDFRGSPLSVVDEAVLAYLAGLGAFKRNAFRKARDHFHRAWTIDTTFGQAAWWYHNAHRWLVTGEPAPGVDLEAVLEEQREDLSELTRMLIEAQLAASQQERMTAYERATERYPRNAYAAFLYAEESQSRGALIGIPLEESTLRLEAAAETDSTFAPTHQSLVWSYLRLGHRDEADESLRQYQQVYDSADAQPNAEPSLFHWLIRERFEPETAPAMRARLVDDPVAGRVMLELFRLGSMWALAQTQADLAGSFLFGGGYDSQTRGNLHEGWGLALVGLGKLAQALWHVDSAAALFDTDEARLEAAEWRVVAPALGLPGISHEEVERGRIMLRDLVSDSVSRSRAAWALGVDAAATGDTVNTRRWLDSLPAVHPDTTAQQLSISLHSMILGSQGMYEEALQISEGMLAYDSAGRGGDPFARAVLHLKRAEWYDSLGQRDRADAARLWYEHFEFLGSPKGVAHASEIDWALSPYVRFLRGRAAEQRRQRDQACSYMSRLTELWAEADSAYGPLRDEALAYAQRRCR
jgi:tetratricopeptide (TPR) repeat protein